MKTYTIYLTALLAIFLCGCNNEIPFNLKENPPKLIMNALISSDNQEDTLYLSMTGQIHTTPVTDATVEVRVNEQLIETVYARPVNRTDEYPNQYIITSTFKPGDIVRIDAMTADGQHHAWAEETVPYPIETIEKVDTATRYMTNNNYMQKYLQYKIKFHDRPNERNYYRLIVEEHTVEQRKTETNKDTTVTYLSYDFINREDVVLTDGQPTTNQDANNGLFEVAENVYNVFDDSRFTNTSYTMTVYNRANVDYSWNWHKVTHAKVDVVIRILSITETEYYYLKSLNALDSGSYDESVGEPIRFPSNVNGGTGIVGFSSERTYPRIKVLNQEIKLEDGTN